MNYSLPISEARKNLPELVDLADTLLKETYISVKGKVKAAIVSADYLSRLKETLEILSDRETMKKIQIGKRQVTLGKTVRWEDIKLDLDL